MTKILITIWLVFFSVTMFMIWHISTYAYRKTRRARNKIIDYMEAHWNLYVIKLKREVSRIEATQIECVEVEEVKEIDRPEQWKKKEVRSLEWEVSNYQQLGERFANTKLIE